ncbi:MAG: hypothetical protein HYR96_00315 [Deltaproteobacteria bacterium]|nr:hypothetical protein [Deltaproteobacteria bacterium]MBI3294768.1 hypothetical protein [Deltaproteobacteria bacterium]
MQNGWIFDMDCQAKTGFKIDPAWQFEAIQKEREFQEAWNKNAKDLIETAQTEAGRIFQRSELDVTLSVCNFTPMARPFIMTVKLYLDSYAKSSGKEKWTLGRFVVLTHHELIHHLLDNTENLEFRAFSALSQKYKAENPNVLAHTHLMAVQKAVYVDLERTDLLNDTNAVYAHIGGDYARSWEIVNSEGTDPFLFELKAWNRKTR